jgi:hypothetical protein
VKTSSHAEKALGQGKGSRARADGHEHPPPGMVTAADLLAGAVMPMRLRLNVTVRPGSREVTDPERRAMHRARPGLPIDARVGRHARSVLEWARRDARNANLLLTDPVAAFARAGIRLSQSDQAALRRSVESVSAQETLPAGVELVGLNVNVVNEKYRPPSPREAQPKASSARRGKPKKGGHHE